MTPHINKVLRQITELNDGRISIQNLQVNGSTIDLRIHVEQEEATVDLESQILDIEASVSLQAKVRVLKDIIYWEKMKKRVRDRWARSFEQHSRAPKHSGSRANLKELALEEWAELEQRGYRVKVDTSLNPWGLKITSPEENDLIELIDSNN